MTEVLDRDTIKALGADTRQDIIKLLQKRPYTASELSKKMDKHVTTITEHLNTLEKTGLIKRKESGNKWVYYALSDKGERLFKPKFYTWVVVLAVSVIFLFAGVFSMFSGYYGAGTQALAEKASDAARASSATEEMFGIAATEQTYDYTAAIGIILIIIAIIGIAWFIQSYRKYRKAKGLKVSVRSVAL